jgi:hypothetical protein
MTGDYSLKSTNNNAQVFTLYVPKVLRGLPLLLHVSVEGLPPSSGSSHLKLRRHLWDTVLFHTHIIGATPKELLSIAVYVP